MNIYIGTTTTPCVGGGQSSDTYWVGSNNLLPITKSMIIQARRPNGFRSTPIIAEKCTEGLPDEKKIPLEKPKSNITMTSWIAWIRLYMEDNGMNTVFRVYDKYLKTKFYLLDDWVLA